MRNAAAVRGKQAWVMDGRQFPPFHAHARTHTYTPPTLPPSLCRRTVCTPSTRRLPHGATPHNEAYPSSE